MTRRHCIRNARGGDVHKARRARKRHLVKMRRAMLGFQNREWHLSENPSDDARRIGWHAGRVFAMREALHG